MENKLSYTEKGTGEPLFFLHGLGGDRNQWLSLLTTDFPNHTVFPDAPGHGANDWIPTAGCNFETFAAEVKKVMDQDFPSSKYIVAGISMGAGIALRLAYEFPEKISKLILVRPAWLTEKLIPSRQLMYDLGKEWEKNSTPQTREWLLANPLYQQMKAESEGCAKSVLGQLDRPYPSLAVQTLVGMNSCAPIDTVEGIKSVQTPTLILGSDRDPLHPLYIAEQLGEWIPNATFVKVPSRYEEPDEHKEALNRELQKFIVNK